MPRASHRAAFAPRSKPAATPPGMSPARPTSWKTPTARRCAFPTAFVSWTGEALDKKTPCSARCRRSTPGTAHSQAPSAHGRGSCLRHAGPEQEYFLIDRNFFFARPDLLNAGRSLFRRQAAQGTGIRRSVLRRDSRARAGVHAGTERELFKLGVPVKTRHNEVAPAQYEIAPVLRERQRRHRPSAAHHDDAEARGPEVRHGMPAARKAVRRHQRLGQAPQLVAGQFDPRATCSIRATRRTRTCSSWSSARPSSAPCTSIRDCCGRCGLGQ
jgi:hypothetical protein